MKELEHMLIIEDHEIVMVAAEMVLEQEFPGTIIHKAGSFQKGLKIFLSHPLKLVILDVEIPGGSSYQMIHQLRELQPDVPILVYTALEESDRALKFLSAGANGYLCKNEPLTSLKLALKAVFAGKKYVSPLLQELLLNNLYSEGSSDRKKGNPDLSEREIEVINLMLKGKWIKEIASELKLKSSTVSTHKIRIFQKLNVHSVIELFRKVQEQVPGIIRNGQPI